MSRGTEALKVRFEKFFPDLRHQGPDGVGCRVPRALRHCDRACRSSRSSRTRWRSRTTRSARRPEGIKPEWYFFFVYYPLELLPFWVIILASNAAALVLLAAPWIFRGTNRKTLRALAFAGAAYLIIITIFGQQIYDAIKGVQ